MEWKTAKSWKKWPENGQKMENSLENPFSGRFLPGLFSIWFSIFSPFPAFGRFPFHTCPA